MSDSNNSAPTPSQDEHPGVAFIRLLFQHTERDVYFSSLPNERNDPAEPSERRTCTREPDKVTKFASKYDRRGRGLFFCCSTIEGTRRNKEAAREVPALWSDQDMKALSCSASEALDVLLALRCPPSIVNWSGHGWHPYWLLNEPADAQVDRDRIERVLRQLADVIGGDLQVCEVARLMRLPGTHNTKGGENIPVRVEVITNARYELSDLEDWLAEQSPVLRRKAPAANVSHETHADPLEDNAFLRAARDQGYKPPIDCEALLAGMTFPGNVHQTQISVSASMLNAGHPAEEVVAVLLEATARAAGDLGSRWNWRREEQALQRMCATWVEKHPPPERAPRPAPGPQEAYQSAPGPATVTDLGQARAKKQAKAKPKGDSSAAEVVADGVVNALRDRGEDIMLAEGLMWLYRDGIWREADDADEQGLLVLIQLGFKALGVIPKGAALALALKHLKEAPALFKRDVPWAGPGAIVCTNGVIWLDRKVFEPQSPANYARRRIGTAYVANAPCILFLGLLASMFAQRPDGAEIIGLIQEWAGAALAVDRLTREERKALVLVGPSRTGKTELARMFRLLLGGPIASPSVEDVGTDFGLQTLLGAVAWIRDDAINEGDKVDPQRFKTIITGEPVDVRRKNKINAQSTSFNMPVLLTANTLPRARDASDAIFNRSLVVEMLNVISEEDAAASRRDHGITAGTIGDYIWERESGGILEWALIGLERLRERCRYDPPESVRSAIQRFKDTNNPVGEWARDAIEIYPNNKIERADLCCAYHGWQAEDLGEGARAAGARGFLGQLRTILGDALRETTDDSGRRYFAGIRLTELGLRYWEAHNLGPQLRGGNKGHSMSRNEVNKPWRKSAEKEERF